MLMQTLIVHVPAQPEVDADLNEFQCLSTLTRAALGHAGVQAADRDYGVSDQETSAVDAIANILHWLDHEQQGLTDLRAVLDRALTHHDAER